MRFLEDEYLALFDAIKSKECWWDNFPPEAWRRSSFALIACDGKGYGAVLATGGPAVRFDMEEGGLCDLKDLGFDDAPCGLRVWEGRGVWHPGGYENPSDGYSDLDGEYRTLTDEEWDKVKAGQPLWNDDDWRRAEDRGSHD